MAIEIEIALCAEYERWCWAHDFPLISADELLLELETLSPLPLSAQRA